MGLGNDRIIAVEVRPSLYGTSLGVGIDGVVNNMERKRRFDRELANESQGTWVVSMLVKIVATTIGLRLQIYGKSKAVNVPFVQLR